MSAKFDNFYLLSFATQLGFTLITPLLVFIGLGIWADSKLGTKPNMMLGGLTLGFVVSIYLLYKTVKQYLPNSNK